MAFGRLREQPYGQGFDTYSFEDPAFGGFPGTGGEVSAGELSWSGAPSDHTTPAADPFAGDNGPSFSFGSAPPFVPPEFQAPTFADAQNEPGYQFRLKAGSDALERSAAARGTLRTGGTLKDIMEYGQKFGSQEYGNVYNRALAAYDRRYQGAKDKYAPLMAEWQLRGQGELQRALALYKRQWDRYAFDNQSTGGGSDPFTEPPPEWKGFTDYSGFN